MSVNIKLWHICYNWLELQSNSPKKLYFCWQFDLCELAAEMDWTDRCNESHLGSQHTNELIPQPLSGCVLQEHTHSLLCIYKVPVLSRQGALFKECILFHFVWCLFVVMGANVLKVKHLKNRDDGESVRSTNRTDESDMTHFLSSSLFSLLPVTNQKNYMPYALTTDKLWLNREIWTVQSLFRSSVFWSHSLQMSSSAPLFIEP